jgi:hypothetical protein
MQYDDAELWVLNNNPNLDFVSTNDVVLTDDFINPYKDANISSQFYDNMTFISKFKNSPFPIFLNLNVQSLISKHTTLKNFVLNLINNHVNLKIICLQEIWSIPFPDLVNIPGFTFIYKQRTKFRGGGVGFYIKNDIKYKILPDLSPFIDKIFESITIEIVLKNKKCILCNYYRSPSLIQNMTSNDQMTEFVDIIDNLSSNLSNINPFKTGPSGEPIKNGLLGHFPTFGKDDSDVEYRRPPPSPPHPVQQALK